MFTIQNHIRDSSGPKNHVSTDIFIWWCNKLLNKRRDATRSSWAWPSMFLCRIVQKHLWKMEGTKKQMNFGSHNTLAIHLLPCLFQPLSSLSPLYQCKLGSLWKQCSFSYGHTINFCMLKTCIIGLCYYDYVTNTCMATKQCIASLMYSVYLRSCFTMLICYPHYMFTLINGFHL